MKPETLDVQYLHNEMIATELSFKVWYEFSLFFFPLDDSNLIKEHEKQNKEY